MSLGLRSVDDLAATIEARAATLASRALDRRAGRAILDRPSSHRARRAMNA
jgi:hypothetical protein